MQHLFRNLRLAGTCKKKFQHILPLSFSQSCNIGSGADRSEIVFWDLETNIPTRKGQPYAIFEFGSILVCPEKLIEVDSYDTVIRPLDPSLFSAKWFRSNGFTADHVMSCPTFLDIADKIYGILDGRVWAGHNIDRFDCARLKEAYAQINRPPPVPKRTIDTLSLLTKRFGKRAGDMKMASLAAYFGLGEQSHRSLDDVRMNLEVVKRCAAVLFLQSTNQEEAQNNWTSLRTDQTISPLSSTMSHTLPPKPPNPVEYNIAQPDPFHTSPSAYKMESDTLQPNEAILEESSTTTVSTAFSNHTDKFIEPKLVSIPAITVTIAPFLNAPRRIQILHRDSPLQIHCQGMRLRFGLSTQFLDHAGNPRLSFVVDAKCTNLLNILDACDDIAKTFILSGGSSQWTPVVSRKPGFYDSPTIRLHLPTAAEDTSRYITEIYYKNSSSIPCTPQLVSGRYADVTEVESLFRPGSLVDAYFSLDPYDYHYQQHVGIRLVAKKLIIHTT